MTWGMMLARLAFMSRPYSDGFGALGDEVEDADAQPAHGQSSYGTAFSLGCPGRTWAPEPSGRTAKGRKCGNV